MADGDVQPEAIFEGLGQGPEGAAELMDRAFVGMLNVLVDRVLDLYGFIDADQTSGSLLIGTCMRARANGENLGQEVVRILRTAQEARDAQ